MNVYVVMWLDRHADPEPELYADREAAIARAAKIAIDRDRHGVLYESMSTAMYEAGWLYYGKWGNEGNYVFVVEREVQP